MKNTYKLIANKHLCLNVINSLNSRGIDGYFCETSKEACELIKSLIPPTFSIAWGGSETIKETGIMDVIKNGNYILFDRATAKTPEESREMYAKHILSDYYLMSSNAITYDGQLVNIDGSGNRTACLIHGAKNVLVIAGVNKLVKTLDMAVERSKNCAAPPNVVRLNRNTPCKMTGRCVDCQSEDCICCNTVITRRSNIKGRIKVILINEELGY